MPPRAASPSDEVVFRITSQNAVRRIRKGLDREFRVVVSGNGGTRTLLDTFERRLVGRREVLLFGPDTDPAALRWETTHGALLRRLPLSKTPAFAADLPAGPFRTALEKVTDVRRLFPQAKARIDGERLTIHNKDQKVVARLTFERWGRPGRSSGAKVLTSWLRLSPVRGYERWASKVGTYLMAEQRLAPSRMTEDLGWLVAVTPWIKVPASDGPVPLEPGMRADLALRRVLQRQVEVMKLNEPGTRKALDPEFLHDYRVAIRRTRAALSSAKGILPAPRVAHFKSAFRWLGAVTSPPRDFDVHILRCPEYEAALPPDARPHLGPLEDWLAARRVAVQKTLVRALDSVRYRKLLQTWEAFLDQPGAERTRLPQAARPAKKVASSLIARRHRRLLEHGLAIDAHTPAAALHEVRLDGKKLRYLLEFFRSLYDHEALAAHVKAMKRLQDCLGDFNDFEVQQAALTSAAEAMVARDQAPPETLLAIGQLVASLAARQQAERQRFHDVFAEFASAENRERARALFGAKAEPRA